MKIDMQLEGSQVLVSVTIVDENNPVVVVETARKCIKQIKSRLGPKN